MNAFPADYVVHNLPLLLFSGLEPESNKEQAAVDHAKVLLQEGGFRIKTDAPPVSGDVADILRESLLQSDASLANWNGKAIAAKEYAGGYKIRSVGRVGQALPGVPMGSICIRRSDTNRHIPFLLARLHHLLIPLD
jgi:hypothetical protein